MLRWLWPAPVQALLTAPCQQVLQEHPPSAAWFQAHLRELQAAQEALQPLPALSSAHSQARLAAQEDLQPLQASLQVGIQLPACCT